MIKYFYDRVQKKNKHFAEQWAKSDKTLRSAGGGDCTAGYSYVFAPLCNCEVRNIAVQFSSSANKTYAVKKIVGRGILSGLNDMLYLKATATNPQTIVLSNGFYRTGALLAAELKSQLDANTAFLSGGLTPFTVSFNTTTGLFTIQPSGGNFIQYLDFNKRISVRQYSTAGYPMGLNANTTLAASIVSDTAMLDIGSETAIASGTASAATDVMVTEPIILDEDQAIVITVDAVGMNVKHSLDYKVLN